VQREQQQRDSNDGADQQPFRGFGHEHPAPPRLGEPTG
jgi:hypothetical protein